jgi:hypothetical protein
MQVIREMMRRAATTGELARKGLTPLAWPHDGGMLRMLVIALLVGMLAPAHGDTAQDRAEAGRAGLDPVLLLMIAELESGGDPRAVTGYYEGVFQLDRGEFRRASRSRLRTTPEIIFLDQRRRARFIGTPPPSSTGSPA